MRFFLPPQWNPVLEPKATRQVESKGLEKYVQFSRYVKETYGKRHRGREREEETEGKRKRGRGRGEETVRKKQRGETSERWMERDRGSRQRG